jgi:hypothetical protein
MPDHLIKNTPADPARWTLVLTSLLFLLVAGCHRDEVKVYQTAKDQNQSPPQTAPALSTDSPNPALPPGHPDISSTPGFSPPAMSGSGSPRLTWKTPDGWKELAPGQMRVASFKITGAGGKLADVSIIPLGGIAGGDVANVNRWRGQVGLEPVPADEIKKLAQSVEVAGQPADLYELAGKNPGNGEPAGILAAITQREDTAWFFKMTGDPEVIAEQKPAFVEFLKSVRFETGETAGMPPGHPPTAGMNLPGGHPDVSSMPAMPAATDTAPSTEGRPNWQVPAGWEEVSGGQFLVAKFNITGQGGTAAVNVSSSAGEGGGLAGNVNRWRGQLGLAPWSESDLNQSVTVIDMPGGKASLVDMNGTDTRTGQPTRLVGVVVPQSGQTWFYKLMGDAKVVESQKDAFTKFVQSVKY